MGRNYRGAVRRRAPAIEALESRDLLTIAHDLAVAIAPYQSALTSTLNAATQLPLVGNQLASLNEFATILQTTEASINNQAQNTTTNGHYRITVPLPTLVKTIPFKLGLDAVLKARAVGSVHAEITPALKIGFDVDAGKATLDVAQTRLDIGFGLSLPGFQGTFSFNDLLYTKAVDAGTNFNGELSFAFDAGGSLDPQFTGEANILLDVSLSFVDPALDAPFNPTFRTTLDIEWDFNTENELAPPSISLKNFGLEADSFLHGFLGDVVKTVQKFTKPIQPFIDVFQTPVPILSAFDSSETIGTLLLKGAGTSTAQQDSLKLMVQIINAVNSIDLSSGTGGAVIPFGNIVVTGNPLQQGGFGFDTSSLSNALDDIFDIPALQVVEDDIRKVTNYVGTISSAGFQFPLLENPVSVMVGLLGGQTDVSLFQFTTGRQHFELAPSIGVGIPGVLGLFLEAGVFFDANLTMGYDTAGLVAYAQNADDPAKLLHGFYFDNTFDPTYKPVPNGPSVRKTGLYLSGLMELKADAVLAHVSGGLNANITVELANTDATNHVHLDTMIRNLDSGGRVFKLGGKLYASADLELSLDLPIGPDITLFELNLANEELLNFDPPPPPSGVTIRVIDTTDQHTVLLDPTKMTAGSVITVQPFHDLAVPGNSYEADGIRVDYPGEIHLYVERKNNTNSNYYNLVTLAGAVPDGATINVLDPFRVFTDEFAVNPTPAQSKPAVMLVGGKNVTYTYNEAPDGSHPNVLLVGGFGTNTLGGGTMTFGNFIPADRIARAKGHFGNTTGFDAAGQGLIGTQIDAATAPANPAGVIGAKMTAGRGGLMMGGPGNNSFITTGAGAYELIGGTWINSFNISPSFSGGAASYEIDGGPYGQSNLIVRAPFDETVLFEGAATPDKYHPEFKALAVAGRHGPSAIAHGIQTVKVIASPGSTVEFGDTSELNIQFSIQGGARLKFSGTAKPDQFSLAVAGPYYAKKDHYTVGQLFTSPANPGALLDENPLVPGMGVTTIPDELAFGNRPSIYVDYLPTRWPDPVYTVARTFGTNGRTQAIAFSVADPDSSSITLDGKGGSDEYDVELGVGGFLDVAIDDSDSTTPNPADLRLTQEYLVYYRSTLGDNSIKLEYFTQTRALVNKATEMPKQYPQFKGLKSYYEWTNSVYYSPTFSFGNNVDLDFDFGLRFQEFLIDRATATQNIDVGYGIRFSSASNTYGWPSLDDPNFNNVPVFVNDPDGPSSEIIYLATPHTPERTFRVLQQAPIIDISANVAKLTITQYGGFVDKAVRVADAASLVNIRSNSGNLTFKLDGDMTGTVNILENSGTIDYWLALYGSGLQADGITKTVNFLSNTGAITVHDTHYHSRPVRFNVGQNRSLANVHGTISFPPLGRGNPMGFNNIVLDDRDNPITNRQWIVDSDRVAIGDLSVLFSDGFYGELTLKPSARSRVELNAAPPATSLIEVLGTGSDNTLAGPLLAGDQIWLIDGPDSGTMRLPGLLVQQLRWRNMQYLAGRGANDTFKFVGGSVSGSIDGGGGNNSLIYDPVPSPFIVDLANGAAPLVGGTVSNIQTVVPDPASRPTVTIAGPGAIDEGGTFNGSGSFADAGPGPWTATVDYGDGTGVQPLALNADKTFSLNHQNPENGNFTVTVVVTRDGAVSGAKTHALFVRNAAPTVSAGGNVNLTPGQSLARAGSFTDLGADTWVAEVDYGAGAGFVPLALSPAKTFSLSNNYASAGIYTVLVRVSDGDGGVGVQQFRVTVSSPPVTPPPRVTIFKMTKKRKNLANLILGFSNGMATTGVVSFVSYQLISAGRDKKFGTNDDKTLALKSVVYDPASHVVTLTPKKTTPLNQPLQFIVRGSGSITDLAGNALDGDNDGVLGGDFIRRFGTKPRT